MFPNIPELNEALTQLVVGDFDELPDIEKTLICDLEQFGPDSQRSRNPMVDPTYDCRIGIAMRSKGKASLKAVIARLRSTIKSLGHIGFDWASNESTLATAGKVLGLAVLGAKKRNEVPRCLNFVLESMSECSLLQVAAINLKPPDGSIYDFGEFSYGLLDTDYLREITLHAGSTNYFSNAKVKLKGKAAISREVSRAKSIDANDEYFRGRIERGEPVQRSLVYRVLDSYFHCLSNLLWHNFLRELDKQQARMAAAGIGFIPSNAFRTIESQVHRVSVFYRKKQGHGWVAPVDQVFGVSIPTARVLKEAYSTFEEGLRYTDWGKFPLDRALQTFSEYLCTVREYEDLNRPEEAFLHCVFALDLLIGGKANEPLSIVFKERLACLSSQIVKDEYRELQKFINECYEFRSSYAHRGERVGVGGDEGQYESLRKRFARLMQIARILFACACWCRRQEWCDGRETWLFRIDVLRAKLNAGVNASTELTQLGLDRIYQHGTHEDLFLVDWEEKGEISS